MWCTVGQLAPLILSLYSVDEAQVYVSFFFFFQFFFFFFFLWLHWVFTAGWGLSLGAASRGYSLIWVLSFFIMEASLIAEHGL